MANSELLIAYGYLKDKGSASKYPGKNPDEKKRKIRKKLEKLSGKELKEFQKQLQSDADHDEIEFAKDQLMLVDYPKPLNKYRVLIESRHQSIEPLYFWSLQHLQEDLAFGWVEKITDIFSASEHSSFWGAATSRLGISQDKVQGYLATIGQLIRKDLFQLVRDIRWASERISYHEDANRGKEDAWVVLKGLWSDLVDGVVQGNRVAPNVFALQSQLDFRALPDLFFYNQPESIDKIDETVDAISTTKPIKSMLKRKYREFLTWKEANYKELIQRKKFTLKYLRQHYNIIRMYISWVKPYLTYVERLRGNVTKVQGADLIASFEGNLIELEIAGMKLPEDNSEVYAVIVLTFEYRTRPQLGGSFVQQKPGYHEGPIHVGQTQLTWRAYAWNADEVENYKRMREREDLEQLKLYDASIKATMQAIGDDLWEYLREADEDIANEEDEEESSEKKKDDKPKRPPAWQPLTDIGKGMKEIAGMFSSKKEKKDKGGDKDLKDEYKRAEKEAKKMLYTHYKSFKKSHGMTHW